MEQNQLMTVENYPHLDEATIVNSNGTKYAVGVDDSGYTTILMGEVILEGNENFFRAFEREKQGFVQIPQGVLSNVLP